MNSLNTIRSIIIEKAVAKLPVYLQVINKRIDQVTEEIGNEYKIFNYYYTGTSANGSFSTKNYECHILDLQDIGGIGTADIFSDCETLANQLVSILDND